MMRLISSFLLTSISIWSILGCDGPNNSLIDGHPIDPHVQDEAILFDAHFMPPITHTTCVEEESGIRIGLFSTKRFELREIGVYTTPLQRENTRLSAFTDMHQEANLNFAEEEETEFENWYRVILVPDQLFESGVIERGKSSMYVTLHFSVDPPTSAKLEVEYIRYRDRVSGVERVHVPLELLTRRFSCRGPDFDL